MNKLAVADCLLSLARVALQEGYVKPEFVEDDVLQLAEGRHPMVETLKSDPFVPNTVMMGGGRPRSKVITGPNMGGKSSAVRMIALCAIVSAERLMREPSLTKAAFSDGSDRFLHSGSVDETQSPRWCSHSNGRYVQAFPGSLTSSELTTLISV